MEMYEWTKGYLMSDFPHIAISAIIAGDKNV